MKVLSAVVGRQLMFYYRSVPLLFLLLNERDFFLKAAKYDLGNQKRKDVSHARSQSSYL